MAAAKPAPAANAAAFGILLLLLPLFSAVLSVMLLSFSAAELEQSSATHYIHADTVWSGNEPAGYYTGQLCIRVTCVP